MFNNVVFRIAGWCALLAVLLMVAFFIVFSIAPASSVGEILAVIGVFVLTPVFYALYIFHRPESAILSLAGLILWIPAAILDIASLLSPTNNLLFALDNLVFSLPFFIFGFLAYRKPKMSRGLAWLPLLTGVFYFLGGAASFIGNETIGMISGLGGLVFMLVWFACLSRVFLSSNLLKV